MVQMKYFLSVMIGMVAGALVGGVVGAGVELVTHQTGWALVVGTLGANGGAFWAAMRRADGKAIWRERTGG
jgi:hypothetical protein